MRLQVIQCRQYGLETFKLMYSGSIIGSYMSREFALSAYYRMKSTLDM